MGTIIFGLLCFSGGFATGVEYGRNHAEDPWGDLRKDIKNAFVSAGERLRSQPEPTPETPPAEPPTADAAAK